LKMRENAGAERFASSTAGLENNCLSVRSGWWEQSM
jgi:hypothetical protein